MNYYEELGVESSAPPEDIRRAYRKLAQLLHPDRHQDETLRLICERQLARLNQIAGILADPGRRREYDSLLKGEGAKPSAAQGRIRQIRDFLSSLTLETRVWIAAAVVGIVLMLLLFRWNAASTAETPYRPAVASQEVRTQAQAAPAAARTHAARNKPAASPRTRQPGPPDAATLSPQAPEPATPAPALSQAELPQIVPPVPTAPLAAAPPPPVAAPAPSPRPRQSYFAGRWFFSHDVSQPDRALYPPEMIELAIAEDDGVLRGTYRGRYSVPDRPVSPDVDFQFEGSAADGQTVELGWTGSGGAQGRVRLTPITPVSMEVNWWATRLGALGLVSGTAVLVRGDER